MHFLNSQVCNTNSSWLQLIFLGSFLSNFVYSLLERCLFLMLLYMLSLFNFYHLIKLKLIIQLSNLNHFFFLLQNMSIKPFKKTSLAQRRNSRFPPPNTIETKTWKVAIKEDNKRVRFDPYTAQSKQGHVLLLYHWKMKQNLDFSVRIIVLIYLHLQTNL